MKDDKVAEAAVIEKDVNNGIEKVENVEMTANKTAEEQQIPTKEETFPLTEKQKEVILAAIQERRFLQEKTQEALKREGDLVSLVIDGAGFDNASVLGAKLSEDGTSLVLQMPA